MRVGILTFHFAPNYGAVLQAYGLSSCIAKLGHEPVVLNYIPDYMRDRASPYRGWGLRSGAVVKKLPGRIKEIFRRRRFNRFVSEHLVQSTRLADKKELSTYCRGLDAVIVGSDQVWNLSWLPKFDDTYFLGFLNDSKVRRIAYAPCFGSPEQPPDHIAAARGFLARFDYIGMRNEFGRDLVHRIIGERVPYVVDPAFHITDWGQNSHRIQIATYAVASNTARICGKVVEFAGDRTGLPIIQLRSEREIMISKRATIKHYLGPREWVQQLQQSRFVCTESFHGAVFCLRNSIPFVAVSAGSRAHRVADLLCRYGLSKRLITTEDVSLDDLGQHIEDRDMGGVGNLLEKDTAQSTKFLEAALS